MTSPLFLIYMYFQKYLRILCICLVAEIKNAVNFIKNTFLLKTGFSAMRNYAETF